MEGDILTINFKELFKVLWKEKWWIMAITALFMALGLGYAFSLREEFTSQGKILPEVSGKGSGSQLSGLAALAGLNLGSAASGTDAIRPDLYPDVINSTPFFMELLKTEIVTKDNQKLTFENYYHSVLEKAEKIDEDRLKKFPVEEPGIIVINLLNEDRLTDLRERVTASIDQKSGVIFITSKMPDPVVAAGVTQFAMNYLVDYITDYRTEKLKQDVAYLGDQVGASKQKYYSDQARKASYADQFQLGTLRSQSADIQRERIESEYRMSSSVYNEILKQYEEAKFKLHQETPVFQVLEPPVVPNLKSEPRKAIILLGFTMMGGIISLLFCSLYKRNYQKFLLKEKI